MARIDFQDTLECLFKLVVLLEHPLDPQVHIAFVRDKADRTIRQPFRHPDILDLFIKGQFEHRDQRVDLSLVKAFRLVFLFIVGFVRRDFFEVGTGAGGGFERFAIEFADGG